MLRDFLFCASLFAAFTARAQEVGPLELGESSGAPGETVELDVRTTASLPICAVEVGFVYDDARLEFLDFRVDGTAASVADSNWVTYSEPASGQGRCGFVLCLLDDDPRVPPGTRHVVGRLRFRIRAGAEAGVARVTPVETMADLGAVTRVIVDVGGEVAGFFPAALIAGGVDVQAPAGPRPVGDLRCEQFLDRVIVSFFPTEQYDELEVFRDDALVATLPGAATEYVDSIPSLGSLRYGIVARREEARSRLVECEVLAVAPAGPGIEEFQCDGSLLSWTNPVRYDRILVFRNGDEIQELSGNVEGFRDPERPAELTVYSIIAELEGFRSPEVHCIANGVWIMEAGDVQVPVGAERIDVPIYVTTATSVQSLTIFLEVDQDRLRLVGNRSTALDRTAGYPDPELFFMGISGDTGTPAVGLAYDVFPPVEPEKDLPPGLRQHVVTFTFRPIGEFRIGEVLEVSFINGFFSVRYPLDNIRADALIPAQIRFGSVGPQAVSELRASVVSIGAGGGAGVPDAADSAVILEWTNGSAYDAIRIERNGELLTELPGTQTAFSDASVPDGVYTYKVSGTIDGQASFPRSTLVSTFLPPGTFVRGDASRDGTIDISDSLATLNFLFLGGPALPCDDAADTDDDGKLTLTDPISTLNFLFLGRGVIAAPGTAHAWFDPTQDGLTCRE